MELEKIKSAVAPCGLNCEKCFAHTEGEIRKASLQLKEALGNFEPYAKRFEIMMGNPVFQKYAAFKEMLDFFASENCKGCRNEQCKLFKDCGVRPCQEKKQVDFCYQCDEFPCGNTNFNERLEGIWVKINRKIQKDGIEQYYEETGKRPRYV